MQLRDLVKQYAADNNIPEEEALSIVIGMYSSIKISMNRLEHIRIKVPGLGVFSMKHWKAQKELESLIKRRNKVGPEHKHWYNKGIELMKRAAVLSTEEVERKQAFKQKKKQYKDEQLDTEAANGLEIKKRDS
jgi:nucleoid DNA-binding protein